jgi:hypothetical protein
MMRTGRILEHRAVDGVVVAMAMTMTKARATRECRAVRKALGKGSEKYMGRGRTRGRQQRKGRRRGREMVKRKVCSNKSQQEMTSLVPLLGNCRRK